MSVTACSCGDFTFYCVHGGATTQVYPLNFLETSLVDELESGQVFYRKKFQGKLTFGGRGLKADYTYLLEKETNHACEDVTFNIYKDGFLWWTGIFSTTDGDWDHDECTFQVTPYVYDKYSNIYKFADVQYNVIAAAVGTTITTEAIRGVIDVVYDRNKWLTDVIDYLANEISPGSATQYTFFTAANNPATQHANHLLYLTIAQKSDIIRPTSSDAAVTALMSWNELMDILWTMFQVKWDYVSAGAGTIRVEHVDYWPVVAGLDLRGQRLAVGANKYSYLKTEMPRFEEFAFMESANPDFYGVPISYYTAGYIPSKCVDPNPETYTKKLAINVTTDLEHIIDHPEAISDDGFVILCNYKVGALYFVRTELGMYEGEIRLNMDLAWANLHYRYFMHNRVLLNGWMNGIYTTFFTAQKTKLQEINAFICDIDTYDPANTITTELGEVYLASAKATVMRSEYKSNGEMKFNLLYGPADNAKTEITDPKYILIEEGIGTGTPTLCLDLIATLSEATLVNLDVLVKFDIFDLNNVWQWSNGAGETWTMLAGAGPYNKTLADDGGGLVKGWLEAGGRIYFSMHWEVVGDPLHLNWDVWFDYGLGCRYCT